MKLYYIDQPVAEIIEDDANFPTFFGSYVLTDRIDDVADGQIKEYHDYSVVSWPLIEEDRTDEINGEEEEGRFGNLIESSEWWLHTGTHKIPILIPVFCSEGKVNWRLDPDRKTIEIAEHGACTQPSVANAEQGS